MYDLESFLLDIECCGKLSTQKDPLKLRFAICIILWIKPRLVLMEFFAVLITLGEQFSYQGKLIRPQHDVIVC